MISINVIIFSIYMFCEVYRSHPEGSGGNRFHPADIRRISGGYPPSGVRVPAPDIRPPEESSGWIFRDVAGASLSPLAVATLLPVSRAHLSPHWSKLEGEWRRPMGRELRPRRREKSIRRRPDIRRISALRKSGSGGRGVLFPPERIGGMQ